MAVRRPAVLENRYILEFDVGMWTYGTVQVLKERDTNQMKSCKVVQKATLQFTSDMLGKLDALKSISHPHIAAITDVLEDRDNFYIISDHLQGGDVQDWLERLEDANWVREETCAAYIRQVLLAVAHCHGLQLYHGDLRPSNLVLTSKMPDAAIKVSDIGLSGILDPSCSILRAQASPYTVPDVVQGRRTLTCNADIWSIGALAQVLLTGRAPGAVPHAAEPASWSFAARAEPDDELWADRSDVARDFVCKCLRQNGERPTAAKLLWHPWLKGTLPLTRQMLAADTEAAREVRHRTLCYMLAVLLLPAVVPHKDFDDLRESFRQWDPDRDGLISRDAARGLLLSRTNFMDAVEPALRIVDVAKTDVLDLCGAACADLIVREFFAAGPTNSPLMGPFTATDLAPRMLGKFFSVFGSRETQGGVGSCKLQAIRAKLRTATMKEVEHFAKVDYATILDALPDDDKIDSQLLTSQLCNSAGRGTPLGAEVEMSPVALRHKWNSSFIGMGGFFQTCGMFGATGRDESPDSIRIA